MSGAHDLPEGPLLLVPEGERVVVFFFPLEDGFGWLPGESIQLLERPHPSFMEAVRVLTGTDPAQTHYPGMVLKASLICHEVPDDAATSTRLTPMLEAFHRGFPHSGEPPETRPVLDNTLVVVEVAVPLITMLAGQMQEHGLAHQELPDLQDPAPELMTDAFDVAMKSVRHLQRSYGGITRRPVKLLSRQQLPPVTIYGVRNVQAFEPGKATVGLFLTNDRIDRLGPLLRVAMKLPRIPERPHQLLRSRRPL